MLTIRASSLPSYCDCPRRSATRLIGRQIADAGYELRETTAGIGSVFGTAFHAGACAVIAGKLAGVTVSQAQAVEMSINNMEEAADSAPMSWDNTTPSRSVAQKQLQTLHQSFYSRVEPGIEPAIEPETRRLAKLSDTVTISGQLDVETTADKIADFKTGRLQNHFGQMGIYSLLRKTNVGKSAEALAIIHFLRLPVSKPYPGPTLVEYPVAVAERTAWAIVGYMLRDVRKFTETQNPDAFMANPQTVLCSAKFCPAWGTEWCEITMGAK